MAPSALVGGAGVRGPAADRPAEQRRAVLGADRPGEPGDHVVARVRPAPATQHPQRREREAQQHPGQHVVAGFEVVAAATEERGVRRAQRDAGGALSMNMSAGLQQMRSWQGADRVSVIERRILFSLHTRNSESYPNPFKSRVRSARVSFT